MSTTKTPHAPVIGRLYWDATHPSPWMSFPHKTAFHRWTTEVRKARPGTKTEFAYYDLVWTADAMLSSIQWDAAEDARTA
jgi:hypothetical protein